MFSLHIESIEGVSQIINKNMSIIAVEKTKENITFAWDSLTIYYDDEAHKDKEKVKDFGPITVGFVGYVRSRHYIYNYFKKITANKNSQFQLNDPFSVISIFDDFKKQYKEIEHLKFDENDAIVISDRRRAFIYDPFKADCHEIKEFDAIGSGAYIAMGAYRVCKDIERSVGIACEMSIKCGLPVNKLTTKLIK